LVRPKVSDLTKKDGDMDEEAAKERVSTGDTALGGQGDLSPCLEAASAMIFMSKGARET